MRHRRPCLGAIVSALLACALGACVASPTSVPSPPPTVLPTTEPTPAVVQIEALDPGGREIHLWHSMTGAREVALLTIAHSFEQSNPYSIRVRVEFHSPLHREVLTAVDAGTPPDIVVAHCEQIVEYADLGAVAPLAEYMDNGQYGLSKQDKSDLWPAVLGGCSPAGAEQPLGLLLDSQMVVMYYNADWLEELGVEAAPRTWEEFRNLCNAARDEKAEKWGCAAAMDGSVLVNWILGLGGAMLDPNTGEALLDSPEAIAALSVLRDVLQDECAYCASQRDAAGDFASGKTLLTFGSTADLPNYVQLIASQDGPRFNWGIAPVPYLTQEPVVAMQGSTVSILRTAPSQELAAWLFLKWLFQPLSDAQWVLASGALPTLRSTRYISEMQDYLQQNPQYETACGLLAYGQSEPAVPNWQAIRALLAEAAMAVCQGQAEPGDALAAADTAADRWLGE